MSIAERLTDAIAYHNAGRIDQAGAIYEAILGEEPNQVDALHLSALVMLGRGDIAAALERLRRALALAPERPVLHNDLGAALRLSGQAAEAAASFERAIGLNGDYGEAWHNLGMTRRALGELQGAAEALGKASVLRGTFAPTHNALGIVLEGLGRLTEARAAFARAVEVQPDYVEAMSNLGLALHHSGDSAAGLSWLGRAIELKPDFVDAHFNLGVVRQAVGDFATAIETWRRTLDLDPNHREALSNLMALHHYDPTIPVAALAAEAVDWGRRHGAPEQRYAHWPNAREAGRRLRIGYVSPDFREHSCAHFITPLFEAHDRAAVEIFAYAQLREPDAVTARLRGLADHWRETRGRGAHAVAEQIRADQIDILVDLAGHFANNRLDVMALKPAPVAATWLGYPGSTGLSAIDYRLTDVFADPPGAEAHYSESLVRLPRGFLCYRPPAAAPEVAPPPVIERGYVTFGSFNNIQKLHSAVIELWARILRATPDSRLALKSHWLSRPGQVPALRDAFARHGIAAERLALSGFLSDTSSHLGAYANLDIALDPFPYNGTTTTLEALWMGVPVISLAGDRHASRVGVSLLTQAGLAELIAPDTEAYIDKATMLAADRSRVETYRRDMRARLEAAPFMDARGFARDLEQAYRWMWSRWRDAA